MNPRAITQPLSNCLPLLLAIAAILLTGTHPRAAEVTQIVLINGRSIPLSNVALQADKFVLKAASEGFAVGDAIPVTAVDHVFGDKPAATNQAIALLLTGKPADAIKLLDTLLTEHKDTAKLPGNFWLEAARAALVANALEGALTNCTTLGKDISDATPAPGIDPFVLLGKALMLPFSAKLSEREAALLALTTDNMPADLCAYASCLRGALLKKNKRDPQALEAYLSVPCLFPSGGLVVNGVAQLRAAEILTALGRREEALALVQAAIRNTKGTVAEEMAAKLLQTIK